MRCSIEAGGRSMRDSVIALTSLVALVGCALPLQQIGATPQREAYPQERGVVCAVKYGVRQNYWDAGTAQRDGATMIFAGECPAEPNSEGFAH